MVSEEALPDDIENYKNLNKRMNWKSIQNDSNTKPVPEWTGPLPKPDSILKPIDYYRRFIDQELLEMICTESNRYARQSAGNYELDLNVKELEKFIGIAMYMSLVKLRRTRQYWSPETEVSAITECMGSKRWETIKRFLHFNDNEKASKKGEPGYDKIYKIRPFIEYLNKKFNQIPMSENLCIDEQMVPYTGKRGPRYYIKGKPNPWGFKVWALCCAYGILYNCEVCIGPTPKQEDFFDCKSTGNTVCKLGTLIPVDKSHKLYMDNLFSSIPLFLQFLQRGIYCMGTVSLNRFPKIKTCMITDKYLKAKGKSSFAEYEGTIKDKEGEVKETVGSVRVIRWNDNNTCTLMSSMGSAYPIAQVKRWDKTEGKKTEVSCPGLVKYYNTNMGGVDKIDSLIALYRIFLRSRKWFHRLFFHFIDVCVSNAWQIYKRDHTAATDEGKVLPLYEFKMDLSHCLREQNSPIKRAVGRPTREEPKTQRGQHKKRKLLPDPVIQDQVGHSPVCLPNRGKCRKDTCSS